MIYRELGKSGLKVGVVSLGCEGFNKKSQAEADELMEFAIGNGVNFIDIYASDPDLRSLIGNALRGHDDFLVQGHIGSAWKNGQYERTRNAAESRIAFEDLLTRLNRDHLDVGMIHYMDGMEDFHNVFDGSEFLDYVLSLKASGKIRSIGLSSHNPMVAKCAVETGLIDVLMFSVNPCYDLQPPDEDVEKLWADEVYSRSYQNFDRDRMALYEVCERENVGIDVMKAYAGGDLLKADLSLFGKAMTPVQALNYALTRPAVSTVMVGSKMRQELADALAWCDAAEAEKDYSQVLANLENCSWHRHCMYCSHCAPCPVNIKVAEVNKFLNLALAQSELPETVREHYKLLEHHASECIRCGACEGRCPFGVRIREKMQQAVQIFGF